MVTPLALPDIDAGLMKPEPNITCLPPGKDKYPVEDLEAAHDCERSGRLRARGRLHALQASERERQRVIAAAMQNGKTP
ncbi:MAG: hypothetical protein KKA81_16550 [Bacteroidetes bacterium]|nr:hypothetical protein [Bacteroidota bacterium]